MSDLFIKTSMLLTGQSAPSTGEWINVATARDNLFTAYGNTSGSVTLQYKSPFFENQGVTFYKIDISGSGYSTPAFSTSPMAEVRAISSGTGAYWTSVTQQN